MELLSERLDLVVCQLIVAEIVSGVLFNGRYVPIFHVSFHSESGNLQGTAAKRIHRSLSRDALIFPKVLFDLTPAVDQKALGEVLVNS